MTKLRSTHYAILALLLLLVVAGVVAYVSTYDNKSDVRKNYSVVRIGFLNIMAGLPLLVAVDQELFQKHGFKAELFEFKTGNEVATAAISGQIDVIGGAATNAVLDAAAESGKRMEIFVSNNYIRRDEPGASSDFLLSRKDIASVSELTGKRVAIYPGSVGRAFPQLVFPRLGIDPGQITFVEVAPQQWESALVGGSVDAVTALEPFATNMMRKHELNILIDGYYAEVMKKVPASGSWFIAGRLGVEDEERLVAVFEEAIQIIEARRDIVNDILVERQGMLPDVAPQVRLLDWSSVRQQGAVERLREYRGILDKAGVTRSTPANEDWIWDGV